MTRGSKAITEFFYVTISRDCDYYAHAEAVRWAKYQAAKRWHCIDRYQTTEPVGGLAVKLGAGFVCVVLMMDYPELYPELDNEEVAV